MSTETNPDFPASASSPRSYSPPDDSPLPPVVPPARKASLLPQWLLDSKAQLDSVRQNAAEVGTNLKALNRSIGAFATLVETSRKQSVLDSASRSELMAHGSSAVGGESQRARDDRNRRGPQILLHDVLGPDAAGVVLMFLDCGDWLRVAATCTSYCEFVNWGRVEIWEAYFERHGLDGWSGAIRKEERGRSLEGGAKQFYTVKKRDIVAGVDFNPDDGAAGDEDEDGEEQVDDAEEEAERCGAADANVEEGDGGDDVAPPLSSFFKPLSSPAPPLPLPLPPSHLQFLSRSLRLRSVSLSHAFAVSFVRRSLGRLVTQRSTERRADVDPHVYSRRYDKEVAFPLAMPTRLGGGGGGAMSPSSFSSAAASAGASSSSLSSISVSGGALMSHVNTLGSDARKDLLQSLSLLCDVSSNPLDAETNGDLLEGGVITVLSALLANESGAIKELAALNLANFLVTPPEDMGGRGGGGKKGGNATPRFDRIGEAGFIARARDEQLLMSSQRVLQPWSLGSSSIRVSALRSELIRAKALPGLVALLSSPRARVTLHNARHSDLSADRIASMRCQSLANKHAARGLVNLLLPDLEICMGSGGGGGGSGVALPPDAVAAVAPTQQQQGQTVAVIRRSGVELIPVRDLDDAAGGLRRAAARDPKELDYLGPDWRELSGGGKRAVEWTAFYFYSSGTLKDQFKLRMQLGHLVKGTGVDNIGPFVVDGESDTAFGSTSFAFSFTYTNRGARPRGGHVAHIGHWSGGSGALGQKSCGLWGTWEPVSSQQHFELQKGGVFRLIPTEMLERLFDAGDREEGIETIIQPWDVRGMCV